jgi:hypothetical protein
MTDGSKADTTEADTTETDTPEIDRVLDLSIWDEVTERIGALADIVRDDRLEASPRQRADGLRYLTRFLAAGLAVCVAFDDPDYPELGRMVENRMSWGLDNPDCLYSYTRLRGDRTYRISGDPGTACHLELQVNTGHFGDGDFAGWKAVAALDKAALTPNADGGIEVMLSPDRHEGNWMALDDRASFLLMRQYFDDWAAERPADLVIEPVGAPYPSALLGTDEVAAHLDTFMTWLETGARCWADLGTGLAAGEPGPITPFLPPDEAAGLKGQAYGMGAFRCTADEAVVLELRPPDCLMWSISLSNGFWESLEFGSRQSSLNSSQSVVDDDGVVRFVISHDDPGVANWLDPCGWDQGTLAVRYLRPTSVPSVAYTTVDRTALGHHLPAGTRSVSPDERREILERRRRALTHRYRR